MEKLIIKSNYSGLNNLKPGLVYSFLNPFSLGFFMKKNCDLSSLVFFADGWLSALMFKMVSGKKVSRVSFDDTSIASLLYTELDQSSECIAFIGGSQSDVDAFLKKIRKRNKNLKVGFARDGYISNSEYENCFLSIKECNPKVVVIGMGTPKQEVFGQYLISSGYDGYVFTCGGYISQTASVVREKYYPIWIDRLNLRALYRFLFESHTRKRYLVDYPMNIVKFFSIFLIGTVTNRKIIDVSG
jgi:N-acetylglucosaminyldiphosphoundecaprenol N-acetyl-beta-D-mannosaminyltransferase